MPTCPSLSPPPMASHQRPPMTLLLPASLACWPLLILSSSFQGLPLQPELNIRIYFLILNNNLPGLLPHLRTSPSHHQLSSLFLQPLPSLPPSQHLPSCPLSEELLSQRWQRLPIRLSLLLRTQTQDCTNQRDWGVRMQLAWMLFTQMFLCPRQWVAD